MTDSPVYGRRVSIKFNGVKILNLKGSDLSQNKGTRDATTKESNDQEESRGTITGRTFSFNGLMPVTGPNDVAGPALEDAFQFGTIGTCTYGDDDDSYAFAASGYLTALNFKASHDGNVEMDGTFKITGVMLFSSGGAGDGFDYDLDFNLD